MKTNSQKVFDEVGFNMSEEVKDLIRSLDGGPVHIQADNSAKEELDKLRKENEHLKKTVAELEHMLYENEGDDFEGEPDTAEENADR